MKSLEFAKTEAQWIGAGLLLAFASSFGQTFFISLFGAEYREAYGLSDGEFGLLYTAATLGSAVLLTQLGGLADTVPTRRLGVFIMLGLAGACALMALSWNAWALAFAILGLRFFGQGMLSHLEVTSIARWYVASRGRALAISSWGHPLGEGTLPLIVVGLLLWVGDWRSVWWICTAFIVFALIPLFRFTLRGEREPRSTDASQPIVTGMGGRHWTRGEAIRHRLFWLLLIPLMASPLIGTAALFHQARIAAEKGWTIAEYAAGFPVYAAVSVVFSMIFGVLIDKYSARAVLPLYLLPLAAGMAALWWFTPAWGAMLALGGIGAAAGAGFATVGAMWAELYGTKHLGSIRALSTAAMVLSTALGPGLTGLLIDMGVRFETQSLWLALWSLLMAGFCAVLMRDAYSFGRSRPMAE